MLLEQGQHALDRAEAAVREQGAAVLQVELAEPAEGEVRGRSSGQPRLRQRLGEFLRLPLRELPVGVLEALDIVLRADLPGRAGRAAERYIAVDAAPALEQADT